MKTKQKIKIGIIAALFSVATIFNMGIISKNSYQNISLESIAVMAKASPEESNGYLHVLSVDIGDTKYVECSGKGKLECKA